jgi:hypothetical protein
VTGLAQGLFWLSQAPGYLRYRRQLANPRRAQAALLRRTLQANARTQFGRGHGFDRIRSMAEYRERVPLCVYADLEPMIQRMLGGEADLLFAGRARLFEPSGGSSQGPRLIPYNPGLQAQFQAGLAPWIFDMYRRYPLLRGGKAYWSVTPAGALKKELVGFESDAAYFGGWGERLAGIFLAVPGTVAGIGDLHAFRLETLRHLIKARDLRFISVWNPSFLSLLLEALPELSSQSPAELWPELKLVSCWADAHAKSALPALRALLPQAEIQPKGLMATEAIVSIPFEGLYPLAVGSHVFEFLDAGAKALDPWDLEVGREYSVVVTTAGGLYRYRLQDRVKVAHFLGGVPCLEFLGKEDCVSDTCGEKLEEAFVAAALGRVFSALNMKPAFSLLAPERKAGGFAYVLYHEGEAAQSLPEALERELCSNFHYSYSRRLKQLGPLRLQRVPGGSGARYLARKAAEGRQLGSVKALALDPRLGAGGWEAA